MNIHMHVHTCIYIDRERERERETEREEGKAQILYKFVFSCYQNFCLRQCVKTANSIDMCMVGFTSSLHLRP